MLAVRWQPSSDPSVVGYRIYVGFQTGSYEYTVDLGNSNLYLIQDSVVDTTYFFSITAYNQQGLESKKSEEVSVFVPSNYITRKMPELYPNYPNPVQNSTRFVYYIPFQQDISLTIYNILGERIMTIQKGMVEPGLHHYFWNGCDSNGHQVTSGVYVATLLYGQWRLSQKVVIAR